MKKIIEHNSNFEKQLQILYDIEKRMLFFIPILSEQNPNSDVRDDLDIRFFNVVDRLISLEKIFGLSANILHRRLSCPETEQILTDFENSVKRQRCEDKVQEKMLCTLATLSKLRERKYRMAVRTAVNLGDTVVVMLLKKSLRIEKNENSKNTIKEETTI